MRIYNIVYFLIIIFFFFTSMGFGVDESMVLHFTFDEGEGDKLIDDSIHGNNGALIGSPKWVDGKSGKALEFDAGGDSVEVKSSDSINVTQAITMEMWVKTPGGAEVKQAGIEKGSWAVGEYSIYPVYEGGTVIQFFDLPPACGDAGIRGPGIADNEWHHLAGTWDGTTINLYIDGELVKSGGCAGELKESNESLHIGSRLGGERYLTGTVDEVRIYNRSLSQDEIKKDMVSFGPSPVSPMESLTTCWGAIKF
ncbi:hypothetical protein GF312_08340 [Candidatus Poribacteria bacterium]|nr:hypothetical protein [Candidatus Poribacteria bacterium]